MMTFLFWNLMGNHDASWQQRAPNLQAHISRMALTFGIDVFVFAESGFGPHELTATLNQAQAGDYCFPDSNSRKIHLYTRLAPSSVVEQFNDLSGGRLTIRRLTTPRNAELLLAALHFPSRMYWTPNSQALQTTEVYNAIVAVERVAGHRRTVLVGDLNMNPFDLGVIGAPGLNAVMTRDLARVEGRQVAGKHYPFFYNPMWGCFGDRTPGPPGSYFYREASPEAYHWNVFDQVLVRPALMDLLAELRILDSDGQESLVTARGRPRTRNLSDHLPVLFRLDI